MCVVKRADDAWDLSLGELEELFGGRLISIRKDAVIPEGIMSDTGVSDEERNARTVGGFKLDSHKVERGDVFVALRGRRADGEGYAEEALERGASAVICRIGGAKRIGAVGIYVEVEDVETALASAARKLRERCGATVIAVTGSVGKTTVKEMCIRMLGASFVADGTVGNQNNGLGLPLSVLNSQCRLREVKTRGNSPRYTVLELGVGKVGDMDVLAEIARADIAVVTNIGSMHIGNFSSREAIAREKLKLICRDRCRAVVFDGGDAMLSSMISEYVGVRRIPVFAADRGDMGCGGADEWLGLGEVRDLGDGRMELTLDGHIGGKEISDRGIVIGALGEHIAFDCAIAAAVAHICGCSSEDIRKGAAAYGSVGLRQRVLKDGGIIRIVDCYNSGPESVRAALSAMAMYARMYGCKRRIAVLGDMLELGDRSVAMHRALGEELFSYGTDMLFTVGNEAREIVVGAVKRGIKAENAVAFPSGTSPDEIKRRIEDILMPGDAVLYKASRAVGLEKVIGGLNDSL